MYFNRQDFKSITHISANEGGFEELSFEREASFPDLVKQAIRTKSVSETAAMFEAGVEETFIHDGSCWVEKSTKEVPDAEKQVLLYQLKHYVQRSSKINFI